MVENRPFNPSGGEILIKSFGGLIIAIVVSAVVFLIYYLTSDIFKNAIVNLNSVAGGPQTVNPMIGIIMAVIGFLGSFLGSIFLAALYNALFSNRYYDIGKMVSLALIINSFIFIFAAVLYLVFYNNVEILFFVLMFHIIFSVYITLLLYDTIANPNYSAVFLVGHSIGFFVVLFLIGLMFKFTNISQNAGAVGYFLILPIVFAYFLIPLIEGIWEKLYYKLYEMGNNFLYIPSLEEILVDEEEVEEVNVDIDE